MHIPGTASDEEPRGIERDTYKTNIKDFPPTARQKIYHDAE
jgi:hypothetical protein